MNYLALCKEFHRQVRAGEGIPGTLPTAVTGQTDKLLIDIVAWIAQAWIEIQEAKSFWRWMISESTGVETIAIGDSSVTLLGASSDYDQLRPYDPNGKPHVLCYPSSVGVTDAQELYLIPWHEFNGLWDSGRFSSTSGRPTECAIAPDGTLRFYQKANVAYKLKYQYRKTNQTLSADGTTPLMPSKYHMLIVYLALCYYARSNENNNIQKWLGNGLEAAPAGSPLKDLWRNLCREQLPPISYFGNV